MYSTIHVQPICPLHMAIHLYFFIYVNSVMLYHYTRADLGADEVNIWFVVVFNSIIGGGVQPISL